MQDTLCIDRASTNRAGSAVRQARHRRYSLSRLLDEIAAWQQRRHFRWELRRLAKDTPYLIDDIGLTQEQVEQEIARLPFWQR